MTRRRLRPLLERAEGGLLSAEKVLLSALIVFMASMSFLQVVLRGAFSSGFLWADTLLRHLVLWVGFLGAGVAAAQDKQFSIDAASRLLPGGLRSAASLLGHAFAAAVCILLGLASWRFFLAECASGGVLFTAGGVQVPQWTAVLALPAGFALLALHYLLKAALAWGAPSEPVRGEERP